MTGAIVYTSNTGFTAQYAKLLGEELGLPVYSSDEAKKELDAGVEIIYLGWLMAGQIRGYKDAAKRCVISAVCGVGMAPGGYQDKEIRKANAIADNTPLFTLQGGFEMSRLRGINRFAMSVMKRTLGKKLAEKPDKTAEEKDMLELLMKGGSRVSAENLTPVLEWYKQ